MSLTCGRRSDRRRGWYFDGKDFDEIDVVCRVMSVVVVERAFEWKHSRVETEMIVSLLRAE